MHWRRAAAVFIVVLLVPPSGATSISYSCTTVQRNVVNNSVTVNSTGCVCAGDVAAHASVLFAGGARTATAWANLTAILYLVIQTQAMPYVNLLDDSTRLEVLSRTQRLTGGRMFVAGAYVSDQQGDAFNSDAYRQRINEIQSADGVPVIFQSWGLTGQSEADIVRSYQSLATECDRFVGFELGEMFLPFGRIYSLEVYRELMNINQCIGVDFRERKQVYVRNCLSVPGFD